MSNNDDVIKNVFSKITEIMEILSILAPTSQLNNVFTKLREACHWFNDDMATRDIQAKQAAETPSEAPKASEEPHGGV